MNIEPKRNSPQARRYPDGSMEYNFAGPGMDEYEGPVEPDLSQLKRHVSMLPERAE